MDKVFSNSIKFIKTRRVKTPTRASVYEAGIDFYVPEDLTWSDLEKSNQNIKGFEFGRDFTVHPKVNRETGFIEKVVMCPGTRLVIPSGIKCLIDPPFSALIAANKSGVSTKFGLTFTAEVVDSTYTGEIHLGVANHTRHSVSIYAGQKLLQFIHTPLYLTEMTEITLDEFKEECNNSFRSRGENWQGSTDKK